MRLTGLDTMEWLLNVAGPQLIASPGGWLKTLNGMIAGLGWGALRLDAAAGSWRGLLRSRRFQGPRDQERLKTRQLEDSLSLLLETGFRSSMPSVKKRTPKGLRRWIIRLQLYALTGNQPV